MVPKIVIQCQKWDSGASKINFSEKADDIYTRLKKLERIKDMNIENAVLNNVRDYASKTYHASAAEKALKAYQDTCRNISSKYSDSVEISQDGYELQEQEKNLSASSGKDQLGITKGKASNSYVIHFDNAALAYRAVQRGYITVNGQDIPLSDEARCDCGKAAGGGLGK